MTRIHFLLVALVLAAAALAGLLGEEQIIWGTLEDQIIWGERSASGAFEACDQIVWGD